MNRALLWPMLMLASRAECWQVVGAASQPNQAGSLSLGSLPNATTHVRLHHLNASGTFVAATIAVVADAITWAAALPPGQYVLMALPAGVIVDAPFIYTPGIRSPQSLPHPSGSVRLAGSAFRSREVASTRRQRPR